MELMLSALYLPDFIRWKTAQRWETTSARLANVLPFLSCIIPACATSDLKTNTGVPTVTMQCECSVVCIFSSIRPIADSSLGISVREGLARYTPSTTNAAGPPSSLFDLTSYQTFWGPRGECVALHQELTEFVSNPAVSDDVRDLLRWWNRCDLKSTDRAVHANDVTIYIASHFPTTSRVASESLSVRCCLHLRQTGSHRLLGNKGHHAQGAVAGRLPLLFIK